MKKRWGCSLILLLLLTAICHAKTISVQVVQNNPGQERIWETTTLVEQSIIDYFFDDGNIVSNSPIWISSSDDKKNHGALNAALIENSEGGMEFLVRVEVFFNTSKSSNPDAPLLENIEKVEWKIYSVDSGKEVSSGNEKPQKITLSNNNELGIKTFAYLVSGKINKALDGRK